MNKTHTQTYTQLIAEAHKELETAKRELGRNTPGETIAKCHDEIGNALYRCETFHDALKFYKTAKSNRLKLYKANACRVPSVGHSYNLIGKTLIKLEKFQLALQAFFHALDIFKAAYGEGAYHETIAQTYNYFGIALRLMNDFKGSMDYHVQALAMFKDIHGQKEPHKDVAISLKYLGDLLQDQAQYDAALKHYTEASKMYRYVFAEYFLKAPADMPVTDMASVYQGMSTIYLKQSRFVASQKACQQGMETIRSHYGDDTANYIYSEFYGGKGRACIGFGALSQGKEDFLFAYNSRLEFFNGELNHLPIARSYEDYGDLYMSTFEFDKALDHYTQALNIYERIFKDERHSNHPTIARCVNHIGQVRLQQAKYAEAIESFSDALLLLRDYYGSTANNLDIISTCRYLGTAHRILGEFDKGHEYYFDALQRTKRLYSVNLNHPQLADNYYLIGQCFFAQREYLPAMNYYNKSLTLYELTFKNNAVRKMIDVHNGMGLVQAELGNYDCALKYHHKAVTIGGELYQFGISHPDIGNSLLHIGAIHGKLELHDKAFQCYREAERHYNQNFTSQHIGKALALQCKGVLHHAMENFDLAKKDFETAAHIMSRTFGTADHPVKASICKNLGDVYKSLNQYSASLKNYLESLEMRKRCYDKNTNHPDLAESYHVVGNAYGELAEFPKSIDHLLKSLAIREVIYKGEKHEELLSIYGSLGTTYLRFDRFNKAHDYLQKAVDMTKGMPYVDPSDVGESYKGFGSTKTQ